jgi:hypothetical protein
VLLNENFILSMAFTEEYCIWESAPAWLRHYAVINLKDGHRITLNEILRPGAEKTLSTIITGRIKDQYGFNPSDQLKNEGFYKNLVSVSTNFYITSAGIGFHYNPGALGSAVTGEVEVFFRFAEIKDLLLPTGLVSTLFD